MKTSTVLFWIFCSLDALSALFCLFFIYSKNPSSGIATVLSLFMLATMGAVLWANQLRGSGHPIGSVVLAAVPALVVAVVALILYLSLKDGIRMF